VREANSKSAFASAVVEPWMADGDGLGRLKELRRESPGMRIVIVTAHDSFAAAILALRAGADDYLPEPVDISALVDSLLDRERPPPRVPDTPLAAARIRCRSLYSI
jgi:ActR/RegA family two-component response regulator